VSSRAVHRAGRQEWVRLVGEVAEESGEVDVVVLGVEDEVEDPQQAPDAKFEKEGYKLTMTQYFIVAPCGVLVLSVSEGVRVLGDHGGLAAEDGA